VSEHYYTSDPTSNREVRLVEAVLRGCPMKFYSDAGVFSKQRVDFGSQLLIETVEIPVGVIKLLDVGCGYGPVGLTLAKASEAAAAWLIDINARAVELAKKNAVLNRVKNVTVMQSDRLLAIEPELQFDLIVTNPPIRAGKQIVYDIFAQCAKHLTARGTFWVVIQKKQGAPSAFRELSRIFERVEEVEREKGFSVFKATVPVQKN